MSEAIDPTTRLAYDEDDWDNDAREFRPHRRTYWTSGTDEIVAMNRLGRDKPVCDSAITAYQYIEDGDDLYCITIQRFPLDQKTVMHAYLESLDSDD